MKKLLTVIGLLCVSFTAKAETYLFGGIDAGFSGLQTQSAAESDKFGLDINLKGLISFELDKFVIDFGGGWRYDRVSGGPSIRKIVIETRSAFLEASPRIYIGDSFQLGPYVAFHLGSQVGMSELLPSSQSTAFYVGAQFLHEWGNEQTRYRFGVRGGMDLNIPSRTHWMAQLSFQVGTRLFGGSASEPVPRVEERAESVETLEVPEAPPEREPEWIDPDESEPRVQEFDDGAFRVERRGKSTLIITTYSTALNFLTGKSTLASGSERTFRVLGSYLAEHSDNWQRTSIDGHADERGSTRYNRQLSQRRAAWIRAMFVRQGTPSARLYSRGFGEDRPLDKGHNARAWEQNRRVEIVVYGVRDHDALIQLVRSIPRSLASR